MSEPDAGGPREFITTQWSLVVAATREEASRTMARDALEQLCRAYWFPLYAFVRYRGYSEEDAKDLTQAFFARLIETKGFAGADPERGRFRSYLLGAMKHFLTNEWNRGQAMKRGGNVTFVALDALDPQVRAAVEMTAPADPEKVYDKEWAQAVTGRALETLRAEWEAKGKGESFDALKGSLTGEEPPRQEIAERLSMSEGSVKVAIHRLRQRYRELVRGEIAQTVNDPAEIDAEMRYLIAVLRKE